MPIIFLIPKNQAEIPNLATVKINVKIKYS